MISCFLLFVLPMSETHVGMCLDGGRVHRCLTSPYTAVCEEIWQYIDMKA